MLYWWHVKHGMLTVALLGVEGGVACCRPRRGRRKRCGGEQSAYAGWRRGRSSRKMPLPKPSGSNSRHTRSCHTPLMCLMPPLCPTCPWHAPYAFMPHVAPFNMLFLVLCNVTFTSFLHHLCIILESALHHLNIIFVLSLYHLDMTEGDPLAVLAQNIFQQCVVSKAQIKV